MMYGPGSNGKTQVGQLHRGFVRSENAASVYLLEITGGTFATGVLPGKFLNFGDENSVSEIRDATDLKSLTGGGTKRANEKFEKQFDFENEAAMKGLLVLCVEHAKRLIETDGQYSMPEGPAERRLRYEAASDPITRFALRCFEKGEHSDAVLKDDAYTVHKALCEADDERMTDDDSFKCLVTQQTGVDVESSRIRWLTPGDSRDRAWRYARFSEDATSPTGNGPTLTPLTRRQAKATTPSGRCSARSRSRTRWNHLPATPRLRSKSSQPERLGEEQNGVKAIAKDTMTQQIDYRFVDLPDDE